MTATPRYDRTGRTYNQTRRPDPRIAQHIETSLRAMESVVNIGAGTGSYEPAHTVLAVEPSQMMIDQRSPQAAPAVRAHAGHLPIATKSVDAALAVLTVHHWTDVRAGLSEAARIACRRVVILTWDHNVTRSFWLLRDYLPAARHTDEKLSVPIEEITSALPGRCETTPVPIPHDCRDGFGGAYWRRPHAYLDATVRAGMSMLALTPDRELEAGLAHLRDDLDDGTWLTRHHDLATRTQLDLGYRLIVADL